MALTNSQMNLIRALAGNDIQTAKQWAVVCCSEDKTQKNAAFTERYKSMLQERKSVPFELPHNISGFVCAEDVSQTFNIKRYFLSERERPLAERISLMSKAAARLQEMKIPYRNSTLLYGESGTGKSMFARYIAYKYELPFLYLKFSSLISSYMGGTSKNIAEAFDFATKIPCVFMLDELDAISTNRENGSNNSTASEMNRITITIMQELDKIPNNAIIIAATNRIDVMDSAILRRFSTKHEVKPLNNAEKIQMLKTFINDVGINFSESKVNRILSGGGNQSAIINRAIEEIAADVINELEGG